MTHTERNSLDKVAGAVAGPRPLGHSSSRGRHTEHKVGRAERMTSQKQRRQEDEQEQEEDRSENMTVWKYRHQEGAISRGRYVDDGREGNLRSYGTMDKIRF